MLSVNGRSYSKSQLEQELKARKASGQATQLGAPPQASATPGKGVYDANAVATVLNDVIAEESINLMLKRHKYPTNLPITAEVQAQFDSDLAQQYPGDKKELPKAVVAASLERSKSAFFLIEGAIAEVGDPKKYYEEHKSEFGAELCVSHLLVATEDEAKKARARVVGGEQFEAVAVQVSTDTGSGSQGGSLGCGSTAQFVPEFGAAAIALEENQLSEPVKTQFGYHIIKVTKIVSKGYEAAKNQIRQVFQEQTLPGLRDEFAKALLTAEIKLDPRFGKLANTDGSRQVVPSNVPLP